MLEGNHRFISIYHMLYIYIEYVLTFFSKLNLSFDFSIKTDKLCSPGSLSCISKISAVLLHYIWLKDSDLVLTLNLTCENIGDLLVVLLSDQNNYNWQNKMKMFFSPM